MGYNLQAIAALSQLANAQRQPSPARQALGTVGGVTSGAQALGGLTGNQSLANLGGVGSYAGPVLGAAGTGYSLYNIATNPNLSTKQKVGSSALAAGDLAASLAVPYYGLGVAASAVGQQMEKSGSPQIRAGGQQIMAPLLPVTGLREVISGQKSPRAAFNDMGRSMGELPVVGGMFRAMGIGKPPSHGKLFRTGMEGLAGKIPELKGFDINKGNYAQFMDPKQYNSFSAEARKAAEQIAAKMAPLSPEAKGDKSAAYQGQLARALLGNYGNDITKMAPGVLQRFEPPPPPAAANTAQSGGPLVTQTKTLAQQIQEAMNRSR